MVIGAQGERAVQVEVRTKTGARMLRLGCGGEGCGDEVTELG